MCRSLAEGGARCADHRRLSTMTAEQIAPDPRDGVPDVTWAHDDMPSLWKAMSERADGHAVLAAAVDRLVRDRKVEAEITDALVSSLPAGCRLHSLEWRMKSPSSTASKILRKRRRGESPADRAAKFTDTLRYTVCARDHDDIVEAADSALGALVDRGMTVVEADDKYHDGAPYKGLHFLLRTTEDTTFELQVHSELSQQVKDEVHPIYEAVRDPATTKADADRLTEQLVTISSVVPTPRGLAERTAFFGCEITRPGVRKSANA